MVSKFQIQLKFIVLVVFCLMRGIHSESKIRNFSVLFKCRLFVEGQTSCKANPENKGAMATIWYTIFVHQAYFSFTWLLFHHPATKLLSKQNKYHPNRKLLQFSGDITWFFGILSASGPGFRSIPLLRLDIWKSEALIQPGKLKGSFLGKFLIFPLSAHPESGHMFVACCWITCNSNKICPLRNDRLHKSLQTYEILGFFVSIADFVKTSL